MIVEGKTVPVEAFAAADKYISDSHSRFTFSGMHYSVESEIGRDVINCYRFADRYIQKLRREGKIKLIGNGVWYVVHNKETCLKWCKGVN